MGQLLCTYGGMLPIGAAIFLGRKENTISFEEKEKKTESLKMDFQRGISFSGTQK
jgi:hypothetical protein